MIAAMTERLLQYIWQFQYYNRTDLTTASGEQLAIIHPGVYNTNQGPDFIEGRIRVGVNTWVGNIELHVNASDWHRHQHTADKNYDNVILHVVWNNDDTSLNDCFQTLVLNHRVPGLLLQQYETWMKGDYFIPCETSIGEADDLVWTSWKERLMIERLERRSAHIQQLLRKSRFHWEETFWWMVARNFGLFVNADAFLEIAASIPYNVIRRHRIQIHQLEAILFGQAGLLNGEFAEHYPAMLKKEFMFLQKKYDLQQVLVPVHFLRMRPACFPTIRLAQLAMLLHLTDNLFAAVLAANDLRSIKQLFDITANDYWHYHFRFGEQSEYQEKSLGTDMINNILVNTVCTMLFAYGMHHREPAYQQKAVQWLASVPAENNTIIARFKSLGVKLKNAGDTQSVIELKSQYCDKRRCLDCAIANVLLKKCKAVAHSGQ